MSYHSMLHQELRDIRALAADPIGRARELGYKGTDDEVRARAASLLQSFSSNAERFADAAENEARISGEVAGRASLGHLVPPSGTLEDEILALHREGCIASASLTPQGEWTVGIWAQDQSYFLGVAKDARGALQNAKAKLEEFRDVAGAKPMRQA